MGGERFTSLQTGVVGSYFRGDDAQMCAFSQVISWQAKVKLVQQCMAGDGLTAARMCSGWWVLELSCRAYLLAGSQAELMV